MSNNLNQIAHQANIAGYPQVKNEMAELAEEIRTIKNLLKDDGKDKKR
ncbi:MAG: MobC family plasmid mobilization relaxosome protein [Alistipes sp.]|nr:MobC family plasmid mobilization relaxosome protein [Alistipes sp.]